MATTGPVPETVAGGWQVTTPVFEGPFDLLLHLILREEVDLWEVSLARIVDAFLAEVDSLEHLDLDGATEFLLVAATLVELKTRRLLPGADDPDLDEELGRYEARDYLLARLLECKTFQDASRTLAALLAAGGRRFGRSAGPEEPFRSLAPDPLARVGPVDLAAAARRALAPREEPEVRTDHVAPIRMSVRDAVETVLALLPAPGRRASFRDLVTGSTERLEVVVRFLAVLELYKQGVVDLEQATTFGDLQVRALAPGERADLDLAALDDWDDDGGPTATPGERHVDLSNDEGADATVAAREPEGITT